MQGESHHLELKRVEDTDQLVCVEALANQPSDGILRPSHRSGCSAGTALARSAARCRRLTRVMENDVDFIDSQDHAGDRPSDQPLTSWLSDRLSPLGKEEHRGNLPRYTEDFNLYTEQDRERFASGTVRYPFDGGLWQRARWNDGGLWMRPHSNDEMLLFLPSKHTG